MLCVLDTSIIKYICRYSSDSYRSKLKDLLFEKLDAMEFIIPQDVILELERAKFGTCIKDIKSKYQDNIIPRYPNIQKTQTKILNKFKGWVKTTKKENNQADPWVVATAIENQAAVITNELVRVKAIKTSNSKKPKNMKIPHVCYIEKIKCFDLPTYLLEMNHITKNESLDDFF
ncbi:MAG: DUF4411 family protein [Candidatus Kariarchaeaceae archaeon]|jgi:rRNA-processing protein FCF1